MPSDAAPAAPPPPPNRVSFPGAHGFELSGRLERPATRPRAWALFAHCFSCNKDIHAARRLSDRLAEQGIGVLRFDFTGLGHSEGDFADTNFSSNVDDLVAAAEFLEREHAAPALLVGHSLGGAAVIAAAARLRGVKAVATIGAPSDAEHVIHQFGEDLDLIEERGQATVSLAGRPFTIKRQFVEDVRGAKVRDAAAALKRPLLILHAPTDEVVGIENATGLFVAARHPKSFVSLHGADHLLRRKRDAVHAADVIAAWAAPYIFDSGELTPVHAEPGTRGVVVSESGRGRLEQDIEIGSNHYIADEPVAAGGTGKGPDPYEYVAAGLGACTTMTLRMYADRKGIALQRASVAIDHERDYAEDCGHCEEGRKVDIFTRTLTLEGSGMTDAERGRLLEIADKCPVHRTLEGTAVIRTVVAAPRAPASPAPRQDALAPASLKES